MPSYNKEKYISEAIDSVLMQKTDFDFQLIVTDDCSTDATLQILEDYRQKTNKLVVLPSSSNQRLLANIIKAYKYMDTPYFCCLDADDYYTDENFLQKAVDFLEKNSEYSIYAANTVNLSFGRTSNQYNIEEDFLDSTFEDMLQGRAVLGNTISSVFRNNYITDDVIKFLETKIGDPYIEVAFREDDFRNRIHLATGKAHFVNEVVGVYRSTQEGLFQGSNILKKMNLKVSSYIEMYHYFTPKRSEWLNLALERVLEFGHTIRNDLNKIKDFPMIDIIQFIKILNELSLLYPVEFQKEMTHFIEFDYKKPKKLKYKIFYKVYNYLKRKLLKKGYI